MTEIPDTRRQEIERLLPETLPTRARALAVLDGVLAGRVWTDAADSPSWAVVIETADGTVFAVGDVTAEVVRRVAAEATTRSGDLIFGFAGPDDPIRSLLPDEPYYVGRAIDFTERVPPSDQRDLLARPLPDDLRLVPLDAALLPRIEWADDTLHAFGSVDAWTELGLGWCLLDRSGAVVAQGMAGPRTRGSMEMGVWVHESHRRRGFGILVSLYTAVACEVAGARVWWNTNVDNGASIGIARRIGFTCERAYDLVAYRTAGSA
jgi:RimJ/RimL family protein N-acetyltransferase